MQTTPVKLPTGGLCQAEQVCVEDAVNLFTPEAEYVALGDGVK